jgi:hypothetical protein
MGVGLHMQAQYLRSRITGVEDVAVTTHDFYAPDAGDFTTAWMDTIGSQFETFWSTGGFSVACRLHQIRFYDDYNGDGTPGEADYVKAYTTPGGSSGAMLPPQVACSVTELLGPDSRKHWGRFYVPGMSINALDNDGTFNATFVNQCAGAANVLYDAWTTADYTPIVWVAGTPGFNPVPVKQVRVDNIPDIIRRRRYQSVSLRVTHDVT